MICFVCIVNCFVNVLIFGLILIMFVCLFICVVFMIFFKIFGLVRKFCFKFFLNEKLCFNKIFFVLEGVVIL